MVSCTDTTQEHEMPSAEAMLAVTLALMTGYSQALQAELHPARRVPMGDKIGRNLALLGEHPGLSPGFREVLVDLQAHWASINGCTCAAAPPASEACGDAAPCFRFAAPWQLQ